MKYSINRVIIYRERMDIMNQEQYERMKNGKGFIAALDQSGGSTPKALATYGVDEDLYSGEAEMYQKVHEMRTRIIKSPAFTQERILGAILFEATMYASIDDLLTADYLWDIKKIVPFLKIDKGLAEQENGVKLMKDIDGLEKILDAANERNIFGTKMRSVIYEDNEQGIHDIVEQQFDIGKKILAADLMPIIEPEVDIHSKDKRSIEDKLKKEIMAQLDTLEEGQRVMLKLTPPEAANLYEDLVKHDKILRVVFLSGGYPRVLANEMLAENNGVIASFSRALTQDLNVNQSEEEFNDLMDESINNIYLASIT